MIFLIECSKYKAILYYLFYLDELNVLDKYTNNII